jgi:hypothetical protein
VRFEALMALSMKMAVVWDVAMCVVTLMMEAVRSTETSTSTTSQKTVIF